MGIVQVAKEVETEACDQKVNATLLYGVVIAAINVIAQF